VSYAQTPLPLSRPLFPTYTNFPSVFPPTTIKPVQVAKRTTSSTPATSDTFFIPAPPNAIALVGCSISPQTTVPTNYAEFSGQILNSPNDSNPSQIWDYCFSRGTKSAWGLVPFDPSVQLIQVSVIAFDASISYTAVASFLIAPAAVSLTGVSFQPIGGNEVVVSTTQTSASNSAQTVELEPMGNVDFIELLSAWFYTSAGTATGTLVFTDDTGTATIDSTAAVGTYAFNLGAKGSRAVFPNQAQTANEISITIGTAGVGNTSTLLLTYRAGVVR
jgi:hypothetical protein